MKPAARCPQCGQLRRYVRAGIDLSPRLAEAFDMIAAATGSGAGITDEALSLRMKCTRSCARQHVTFLNARLAETDYRIHKERGDGYRLVKICDSLDSDAGAVHSPESSLKTVTGGRLVRPSFSG